MSLSARRVSSGGKKGGLVLVTGALGYTGRALVRALCDGGFTVRASDVRLPRPNSPFEREWRLDADERAHYEVVDVTSPDDCAAAVRGGVHAVFHIGALVPFNLSRAATRAELLAVNTQGTHNLLAAAAATGHVRAFIYASSTGVVFAGRDIEDGDESLPRADERGEAYNDDYSESKGRAERLVLAANRAGEPGGMATVALRPNGIWGVGEAHHTPKVIATARWGLEGFVLGSGAHTTDWVHRDDLVTAFLAAYRCTASPKGASRAAAAGRAYFITSPWRMHTQEFFAPLLSALGFAPAFAGAIVPRGSGGQLADGRWPHGPLELRWPRQSWADSAAAEHKGDEVILTSAPRGVFVPAGVLSAIAAALVAASAAARICLGVSIEPFLTPADVRKVTRHNYYSSARATRVLGWTPAVCNAAAMRDVIAYHRALGVRGMAAGGDGGADAPGAVAMVLVGVGMAALGVLAGDVGGVLTATLGHAVLWGAGQCPLLTPAGSESTPACAAPPLLWAALARVAALTHRCFEYSGAAHIAAVASCVGGFFRVVVAAHVEVTRLLISAAGGGDVLRQVALTSSMARCLLIWRPESFAWAVAPPDAECAAGGGGDADPPHHCAVAALVQAIQPTLVVLLGAAVICHAVQGLVVAVLAWRWRLPAGPLALRSAALGFPATAAVFSAAGRRRDMGIVTAACIAGFVACLPLAAAVRVFGSGLLSGLSGSACEGL